MAKGKLTEFLSIDAKTIANDREITFGVYLYLPIGERSILLFRAGTIPDAELLAKIFENQIQHFFIKTTDKELYDLYLKGPVTTAQATDAAKAENTPNPVAADVAETAAAAAPEPKKDVAKKEEPIPEIQQPVSVEEKELGAAPELEGKEFNSPIPPEEILDGLLSPDEAKQDEAIDKSKEVIREIMKDSPAAAAALLAIMENPINEHATGVAIYSVLIALGLGKKDQARLQDLILSSLLHDIGVTQLPPEIAAIPWQQQTPAQRTIFANHVDAGLALLEELNYKPNKRVVTMLSQHHEKFNGTGYPKKLDSFRVDEDAQYLEFSDLVDSLCRGLHDGTERSLAEAIEVIAMYEKQTTFPVYFNPNVFKKIMAWVKSGKGNDHLTAATAAVQQTRDKMMKTGS